MWLVCDVGLDWERDVMFRGGGIVLFVFGMGNVLRWCNRCLKVWWILVLLVVWVVLWVMMM